MGRTTLAAGAAGKRGSAALLVVALSAYGVAGQSTAGFEDAIREPVTESPWDQLPKSQIDFSTQLLPQALTGPLPDTSVSAGCRVSLEEFEAAEMVVVSDDGSPDPDAPVTLSVLTLSMADYACLFPQVAVTEDVDLDADALMQLAGDAGGENLTRSMFIPNQESVDTVGVGARWLSAPSTTLTIDGDPTSMDLSLGVPALSIDSVEEMLRAEAEALGQVGGYLRLRTYLPTQHDPLFPSGTCNTSSTSRATEELNRVFGGIKFQTFCILDRSANYWSTCQGGCTDNVEVLVPRLKNHIQSKYWGYQDEPHELITTYLYKGSNNGVGILNDRYSIVAERAINRPNAPQGAIMVHELGHNFGATHYPADDWRKYVCNSGGSNPTYYYSVMNYCYLVNGWMKFDAANGSIVYNNIW